MGIEDSFFWDDGVGAEEEEYDPYAILETVDLKIIEQYLRKKKLEQLKKENKE